MPLHTDHRPSSLDDIVGSRSAVSAVRGWLDNPRRNHAALIHGPKGCGKTTVARIMAKELGCSSDDFKEMNTADYRGIGDMREMCADMLLAPMSGRVRVLLLDECHQLTNDAMAMLLKDLEEPPDHIYILLSTTDPQRLLPTVQSRCAKFQMHPLSDRDMEKLLGRICRKEGIELSPSVEEAIVESSMGSARDALVMLETVSGVSSESDQLAAVSVSLEKSSPAIAVARLLYSGSAGWAQVAKAAAELQEDPEGARHCILSYGAKILVKGGAQAARAYLVMSCFKASFFYAPKSVFVMACYEAVLASSGPSELN